MNESKSRMRGSVRMLVLSALFTALIAAGAFLQIPIPLWPFTLQLLFAVLAVLLLGRRWGTLANTAYIVLGLIGLPIFTKGGGPAYLFEPTFGCILGFAVGAFFSGTVLQHRKKKNFTSYLLAALTHMATVYGIGMLWFAMIKTFYLHDPMSVWAVFLTCFVPTVGVDLAKCLLAAALAARLCPLLARQYGQQ